MKGEVEGVDVQERTAGKMVKGGKVKFSSSKKRLVESARAVQPSRTAAVAGRCQSCHSCEQSCVTVKQ